MIILVDMDGVLADFETGFVEAWKRRYPDLPYIPTDRRSSFSLIEEYPSELTPQVRSIYQAEDFYGDLKPISGAVEAMHRLASMGHEVWICSTPILAYTHCVVEKYAWIDAHLGRDWVAKLILTRDKTLITGDILIDDKPDIAGARSPAWEHILYDQPYNRTVEGKRRLTWKSWENVLFDGPVRR